MTSSSLLCLAALTPPALMLLSFLISSRHQENQQKASPFECGFDPKESSRLPFSIRFFLLAVIFLIFDIELALIIPIPIMPKSDPNLSSPLLWTPFLAILGLGVYYEWAEGSLDWML